MDISSWTLLVAIIARASEGPMVEVGETGPSTPPSVPAARPDPPASSGNAKERANQGSSLVALTAKPVTRRLVPVKERSGERAATIPEVVRALPMGRKLILIVGDLRMNEPPGVLYRIYLDRPESASKEESKTYYVGSVNFYDVTVDDVPETAPSSDRFVSFDVTAITKKLAAKGKLKAESTITIVPDGTPNRGSRPWIGKISLIER